MFRINLCVILAALFLCGCSFRPPLPKVEAKFSSAYENVDINSSWWRNFDDKLLDELIATAFKNNSDLLIAANNIEISRVGLELASREFLPNISLNGSAIKSRTSGEGVSRQDNILSNSFSIGALLNYEVDLWGRVREAKNSANSRFLATKYDYESAKLSIASMVSKSYFGLIFLKQQEDILYDTLDSYIQTASYIKKQLDEGAKTQSDYYNSTMQIGLIKERLNQLQSAISSANTALLVLVGKECEQILYSKISAGVNLPKTPDVVEGIPSDLLLKRADVASALQRLKSSNALVGVAKANYFPKLSLSGAYGFSSTEFDKLFVQNANFWNLGANVISPFIDFGRTSQNVKLSEFDQNASYINYEKRLKEALSQTKEALDFRKYAKISQANNKQITALATKIYEIAKVRYKEGQSEYLELLEAQRALLNAQTSLAKSNFDVIISVVDIYKALGGGFEP